MYCLVTIILQSVALLCDLAHQVKFSEDGRGLMFLEVMGTILDMVSESIMTLLVLMLANGWMTGFVKNDYDDYLDVWAPIMMVVMLVHVLSGGLTYVDQDAHHKYHDFHGWQGYFLVGSKLLIAGAHLWLYITTKRQVPKASLLFFERIYYVGLLYLLTDPFAIMTGFLLDEVNR